MIDLSEQGLERLEALKKKWGYGDHPPIFSATKDIHFLLGQIDALWATLRQARADLQEAREALLMLMEWIGPPPAGPHEFDSLREDGWAKARAFLSRTAPREESSDERGGWQSCTCDCHHLGTDYYAGERRHNVCCK